jgi:EpsI family protein
MPSGRGVVNLYVAYYASQGGGESSHSPRTCIPGDGWAILEMQEVQATPELRVNRALIQKGEHRQLVWYWFRQRGRLLTAEWEVKWWILRDALRRGRSDGALVRLVTPILPAESAGAAEQRLRDFLRAADARLAPFIPG